MSDNSFITDGVDFEVLWAAIQAGDETAKQQAIENVMPKMISAIQHRFGGSNKVNASDATQSAFRTIERRKWEIGREPQNWGELAGVLVTFAYNKARTHLKKKSPGVLDEDTAATAETGGSTAHQAAIRNELVERVQEAVRVLTGSLDEIDSLILRGKYDAMTTSGIASLLAENGHNRTESSIRMRWRRNIQPVIRKMLEGDNDE